MKISKFVLLYDPCHWYPYRIMERDVIDGDIVERLFMSFETYESALKELSGVTSQPIMLAQTCFEDC